MNDKKYKPPLKIDMPFDEALERFVRTDPKEMNEMDNQAGIDALPKLRGKRVTEDEKGNLCLNDLWALAGKPKDLRPTNWHRQKRTQALENALQDRIMFFEHNLDESVGISTYYVVGRGGAAKTYAHPVLALEYAENLNPSLGVEIRELFLRYKSDAIGLANDILDRIAEQVQEDEFRIHNREEVAVRNKELAAQGKIAGCKGWEYAELHNSGYRGLYNGLDENGIHRLKKLTKSQKILDHMNAAEGAANVFRVTQAKLRMEREKPQTPDEAFEIAREAGERTRQAMEDIGGVMPEDMEPAESIKKAEKRLKVNKKLVLKK